MPYKITHCKPGSEIKTISVEALEEAQARAKALKEIGFINVAIVDAETGRPVEIY